MFEALFTYPAVLARHQTGPGSAERKRYLAHCVGQGLARETLLRIARELLVVAERIDVTFGHQVTRREIEAAARKWIRHQRKRRRANPTPTIFGTMARGPAGRRGFLPGRVA